MKLIRSSKIKQMLAGAGVLGLFMASQAAFGQSESLGTIATTVTNSFSGVGKLLMATAYVCGFGLSLVSIFKFKAHRDNPQQTALGVPVALLAIGVVLIFLPTLLGSAGETVFGANKKATSFSGAGYNDSLDGST